MKFLLVIVIMTSQNYQRGYGDGIAGSKSASAAVHMERFGSEENCKRAKQAFESMKLNVDQTNGTKQESIQAKCIELK